LYLLDRIDYTVLQGARGISGRTGQIEKDFVRMVSRLAVSDGKVRGRGTFLAVADNELCQDCAILFRNSCVSVRIITSK
jgi:hypothetical protein